MPASGSSSTESSVHAFSYTAHPARIIFRSGALESLPDEVGRLGAVRALVLTTPSQSATGEQLAQHLGGRCSGVFSGAVMHTPTDVTERAVAAARAAGADALVSIGGGSTIGLGKAISLRTDLPHIAIPTTYAGSEVTPILGETSDGVKRTQRAPALLPRTVIYDAELTRSLPPALAAASGMNAIAHAAEALYAQDANPVTSLMAEEGVAALARSLPAIVATPGAQHARADALYGAWLCGTCLGTVGMALHHKLCHVLGGTFDLPHAEVHAVVLPHAIAYNAVAAPRAMARLSRALGGRGEPWADLYQLLGRLSLPTSLRQLGMPASGLDRALELVFHERYGNPRPMQTAPLKQLLENAFTGAPPQIDR